MLALYIDGIRKSVEHAAAAHRADGKPSKADFELRVAAVESDHPRAVKNHADLLGGKQHGRADVLRGEGLIRRNEPLLTREVSEVLHGLDEPRIVVVVLLGIHAVGEL